ncbi:hypothetical protein [Methylobacterium sp. 17Sr1-1]|nr:hypothetical protein [Methylobacterium sp. 17Sr1-1]
MSVQVGREIADTRGKWTEYVARCVAAEDQLRWMVMRVLQDGMVHQRI